MKEYHRGLTCRSAIDHAAVIVFPARHPIRVVLSSTALLPFLSVRKAAALAIAQSASPRSSSPA
jgi:hypothetical protein